MYFNSWSQEYKTPFGAVCCHEEVKFNFKAANSVSTVFIVFTEEDKSCKFQMYREKSPGDYQIYSIKWISPQEPSLLWYYFEIHERETIYYYGNNIEQLGGEGFLSSSIPSSYQLTVYKKNITIPSWYKNGIIYQIFVDRFYNGNEDNTIVNTDDSLFFLRAWEESPCYVKDQKGNVLKYDFFGGNLKGIIKKLPYLKDLGVSIIYLNPIFEAFSNHKYDTADYKKIDPMYGDEETFKHLCREAEKLGIYIILDGVFNHTGSSSIYFNKNNHYPSVGAFQCKKSPYYPWYTFFTYPNNYNCWWGVETMPTINKNNQDYCDFIMKGKESVIHYWMDCGCKGWRLDVVDELPDEFVIRLKKELMSQDEYSILIGEVWEDASNKISYGKRRKYLLGEELDSAMNYPLRKILLSYVKSDHTGERCIKSLLNLYENYPKEYFYSMMNLIGSHDVPRILTELGGTETLSPLEKEIAIKRVKMITLFQMTFPGVPSIYYGDEAGMEGLRDPYNRGPYPWGKEKVEILCWYKKILTFRNNNIALISGEWSPIYGDAHIISYIRAIRNNASSIFILLFNNDNEKEHTISIPIPKEYFLSKYFQDLITTKTFQLISHKLVITIPPLEGMLLKNV